MKTINFTLKTRIIFVIILIFSSLLVTKLYFLEIVNGEMYYEKADRQYVSLSNNIYDRGSIFFRNKDNTLVSAATLKTGYIIAINPKEIVDAKDVYDKMSKFITIDPAVFYSKAIKKDDPYEEISKKVSESAMKKIEEMNIPGIIIQKEKWRYYPGGDLASNLIGFVAYDEDTLSGRYGLEKYYEDTLRRDSKYFHINVFAEIFSNIGKAITQSENREGDIVTTIDPQIQSYVDDKVKEINQKWDSKNTGAIVIDPNTGEIYSMGIFPTFNLNDFSKEKNVVVFSNPSVSSAYEIGSVIKAITVASGIDSGAINNNSTYIDYGFVELNGRKIYNVDKNPRGKTSIQDILNHSMNTGVTHIMQEMGKDRFADYIRKFGIGTETGVDLPGEVAGDINNLKSPREIEFATASFGQGISITPINAARAFSVLANGGKLITPHIVSKIDYKVGSHKNISYTSDAVQVIKKESAEETTRMLVNVVDEALLYGKYKMKNYSVAAKTGTAQIARPRSEGGGYYPDKFLHTFFGYFPAYNPRFLVFLYTVEPKGVDFGSQTLTEPFFDIAKYLINYYEILPDR